MSSRDYTVLPSIVGDDGTSLPSPAVQLPAKTRLFGLSSSVSVKGALGQVLLQ